MHSFPKTFNDMLEKRISSGELIPVTQVCISNELTKLNRSTRHE